MRRIAYLLIVIVFAAACEKELDSPPENVLNDSGIITIDSLRNWQKSVSPNSITITDSLNVYGIVSMDESEGNIYKNLYVQDQGVGINVRLTAGSDFAVGDSIRIFLKDVVLSEYSGVIQLGPVDPKINIVRQSTDNAVTPIVKKISEITVDDEGQLVELRNIQFSFQELGLTYADAMNQSSENRTLEDCEGDNILVRTSGFADFADEIIAGGSGSFVGIVSRFNQELQLYIRSYEEIDMNGERCAGQLFVKDFEDNSLTSGGWVNFIVVGTTAWEASTFSGNTFAKITNWDGSSNELCESWFISPEIDFSTSTAASMSFMNDYNYSGLPLQLLISTDYTGTGNPAISGTWDDISSAVSWDPDGFGWGFHDSGEIDLNSYIGNTVFIAFKYTGTASSGSTWEIDDIKVNG
ncbi:MAG: DUF5689 domain-containing protein [Crocinitomicaceae bacterium]